MITLCSGKKETNFLVTSSITLGRFWWNMASIFLDKFNAKSHPLEISELTTVFRIPCSEFHQNHRSFVEDINEQNLVSFFRTHTVLSATVPGSAPARYARPTTLRLYLTVTWVNTTHDYWRVTSTKLANIFRHFFIQWCEVQQSNDADLHPVKKEFDPTLDVLWRFVRLDDDTKSLNTTGPTHPAEYYVPCTPNTVQCDTVLMYVMYNPLLQQCMRKLY